MTLIVRLLLVCATAAEAHELRISLAGEWRIQTGKDRPEFARADFDDVGWSTYRLPRASVEPGLGAGVPRGTYWLRRTVALPREPRPQRLALTLGELHETYEVFVNGQLAGRTANPGDLWSVQTARPRTFRFAHPGGDRLVIAVRAYQSERIGLDRFGGVHPGLTQHPDPGPYLLSSVEGAPADVEKAGHQFRLLTATPSLVEAVTSGLLAFLILLLSHNARVSGELRVLAYLLMALSVLRAFQYGTILFDWPRLAGLPGQALSPAITSVLAWFMLSVSRVTGRWGHPLLAVLAAFAILSRPAQIVWPAWLFASDLGVAVIAVGAALVGCVGLWRAVREEGWASHRTWLNLIGLLLVLVDYQRTPNLRVVPPYWSGFGFVGNYFDIAVVGLSIAATWVIFRRLGEDRREKHRLSSELEAARAVQQLMLPASGASTAAFTLDAVYEPATEVGGDFHWSRTGAGGSLIAMVGDVSGKGLKAAMLVSVVIGILRNEKSASPAVIVQALNDGLTGHTGGGFVTCCCARFDVDGRVTIANAGHPSPYCDGREVEVEAGLPLGVMAGVAYEETVVTGERFTFLSDGVVEAENAQRELFGFERTREISMKPAREIAEAAKAWGQNDDITVVTVRRNP